MLVELRPALAAAILRIIRDRIAKQSASATGEFLIARYGVKDDTLTDL
jgi:hypothetical protein